MARRLLLALLCLHAASSTNCHDNYKGGGCAECLAIQPNCNYCPKDKKCSNEHLKQWCSCSTSDCIGPDSTGSKTCAPIPTPSPVTPTPAPTRGPMIDKFNITVAEITNALNYSHTGHPLENLIIAKILNIFQKKNISVDSGDITYDGIGDLIVVENTSCKMHVQLDKGWTTKAVLKPDTSVALSLQVGGNGSKLLPELVIGADVHLDSSFHVSANVKLNQGTDIVHPKDKPCAVISTENARETIDGDMNIQANVSLRLLPQIVHNKSTGYHLHFTPTVTVAGQLISFDAKAYSAVSVFGIDMRKISFLVSVAIDVVLKKEITDKLVQKELAALQAKLQMIANQIWPPDSSQGNLPGITPALLEQMESAVQTINTTQQAHYP